MENIKIVENGVEARVEIEQFLLKGFTHDEIYLLAHDKRRSEDLTDSLGVDEIGLAQQGIFNSIGNVFRSRGDELRSKLASLGLSDAEAERHEAEMDKGRVVLVASKFV
ncbi:MAG: general stress protein [Bacillus sp. (in: Bacteria)]|nr:general stress protein [Bacillus sp. (in: firmicutes)]